MMSIHGKSTDRYRLTDTQCPYCRGGAHCVYGRSFEEVVDNMMSVRAQCRRNDGKATPYADTLEQRAKSVATNASRLFGGS